jgi:hypothetical protein
MPSLDAGPYSFLLRLGQGLTLERTEHPFEFGEILCDLFHAHRMDLIHQGLVVGRMEGIQVFHRLPERVTLRIQAGTPNAPGGGGHGGCELLLNDLAVVSWHPELRLERLGFTHHDHKAQTGL